MAEIVAPATERLRVNQVISENTQQVVVRGKITVPDPKPDVDKILSTDKAVKVKKIEIVPDKVIVEGILTLQIIYVAFEPDQSVHHMHQQIPFTTIVEVPGAKPGMDVQVKVTVEDINIMRNRDDARQFDVAAVLTVFAKITEIQEISVLTQCPAGATCKMELIKVDHVIATASKQVIVSDDFDVPREKPSVDKILEVRASAEVVNKRVLKNKVIVDGTVTVEVMYVALEPEQPVHQLHRTFSFSDFVEVPGAQEGMDVRVDVKVESGEVEGDRLHADVILMLTVYVTETKQINVITEITGVQATMARLRIDQVVGEDSTQVVLRDTFETPEPKPEIDKVLDTTVQEVKVTETKILKNKVLIRGYADVQIIYVAATPDQAVHAVHRRLNFSTFVEIPGAQEGMDVEVRPVVEYIAADTGGYHITVELVLKIAVKVTESLQRDVAVAVVLPPPAICVPGEVIKYTIQPGDTFFILAQRYGTTVEAIQQANPGVEPTQLQVGQVINIPCAPAKG